MIQNFLQEALEIASMTAMLPSADNRYTTQSPISASLRTDNSSPGSRTASARASDMTSSISNLPSLADDDMAMIVEDGSPSSASSSTDGAATASAAANVMNDTSEETSEPTDDRKPSPAPEPDL
jgi:hypothetical protein